MEMKKKVLIVGSDSAIGTEIVNHFKDKYNLIGLSRKKINNSITNHVFDLDKTDISGLPDISADIGIVFSSITDIDVCEKFPKKAFKTNVEGTKKILDVLKINKIKRLIYFSTGTVVSGYDTPMNEDMTPSPPNVYSVTKHLAEKEIKNYSEFFDSIVIRPFFVYGPNTRHNRLVYNLITNISKKNTINLNKNAKPKINPIYIDDVIQIIQLLVENKNNISFDCINIAGNEVVSIKELAEKISKILKTSIVFKESENNSKNIIADITKLKEKYNYKFQFKLDEGLEHMIASMQNKNLI
jgi:nucleoside-diphosphate-sugar epimerase